MSGASALVLAAVSVGAEGLSNALFSGVADQLIILASIEQGG